MSDSLLSVNGATGSSASIGATLAGQRVSKAVIEKLLSSIEQAGQSSLQSPSNRVDRVQISQEAQQRLAAEQNSNG